MRHIKDIENDIEYIDLEDRELDGDNIEIHNTDGFGGCNIEIGQYTLTWKQLDKLKDAIELAEKLWR